jgi:hypothetical protein
VIPETQYPESQTDTTKQFTRVKQLAYTKPAAKGEAGKRGRTGEEVPLDVPLGKRGRTDGEVPPKMPREQRERRPTTRFGSE